ncbi:polysaccharide deacetylase family protein [Couchioplanes caeruleus]|uniref:Polysaccharide deacetylase n=2 Tax=Couchioplanes caeruleus TaxID=56438 RepID=A0A1K0FBW3_9ACTN|nr:polysaccharide deacetylase family protein [Couchioplanes caeruleus]OJF10335.1 polysaccharide deacetylase [Couchioplanes caeruleus subsp. caeruleus]ROP30019.1 peptidoglycan/xylan/chitin deacetylase (PgdA/CDA1 family) [Couchioplanes caeruleus]
MRTPKVLVIVMVLIGLAGCGTAGRAGREPAGAAAGAQPSSSVSAPPAPASPPSSGPAPSSRPGSPPGPATSPGPTEKGTPEHGKVHHGGPANSHIKTGGAGVALTFDDGPDPVQTPRLLDLLKKNGVKATFCLVGMQAAEHPELVRRIVREGHALCNHTWRHNLTLGKEKPAKIRADLEKTNNAIRAAVPDAPIKYMRAPGGNFTPRFVTEASRLGMTSIYWQVDPRDWEHHGESSGEHQAKIIREVKRHVGKGSIVLSHDNAQPDTIAAYASLLPWLKKRYQLIALP